MNDTATESAFAVLAGRLAESSATIGVIGLGYVGLPLAAACARAGFKVAGFDIDQAKIDALNAGTSYIDAVASEALAEFVADNRFEATSDFAQLSRCDVIVICVPTPLSKQREPDLSFVSRTAHDIARHLRPGHLVVLESTTYPGTTVEVLKPILESGGLRSGTDFWIGFSPEREDPGNENYHTGSIPKVIAGDGEQASELMKALYGAVVDMVVPVSTPSVAEAVKITENVFRAVNIALVNELKVIYDAMGIDVWEVIGAASTKPFGYMPFYPGPGLGGHCIPIDPFYLTWKSREYDLPTRFIELAGEINVAMPKYVVGKLRDELDEQQSVALGAARILVLGLAYKKNVSDVRESPSFALIELLEKRGSKVDFHDPHVDEIPMTREHADMAGRKSAELTAGAVAGYNAVLVATDHDAIDYGLLAEHARLVVDTRNAFARRGLQASHIVKA
ncbi:MAG: nucleotide sugar dehydrogenase [Pseudomonadota bacterium]